MANRRTSEFLPILRTLLFVIDNEPRTEALFCTAALIFALIILRVKQIGPFIRLHLCSRHAKCYASFGASERFSVYPDEDFLSHSEFFISYLDVE